MAEGRTEVTYSHGPLVWYLTPLLAQWASLLRLALFNRTQSFRQGQKPEAVLPLPAGDIPSAWGARPPRARGLAPSPNPRLPADTGRRGHQPEQPRRLPSPR